MPLSRIPLQLLRYQAKGERSTEDFQAVKWSANKPNTWDDDDDDITQIPIGP
jgi:hypothetical protein